MNRFDAVIVGAGRVGVRVARQLPSGLSVALISLPGSPEDYMQRRWRALLAQDAADNAAGPPPADIPVFSGAGSFVSPHEFRCGDAVIRGSKFVIASGCRARWPAAQGVNDLPLSRTDHFRFTPCPSAVVIGAGLYGVAAAFRLLREDAEVTLLCDRPEILPNEDAEVAHGVRKSLEDQGARVLLNVRILHIRRSGESRVAVVFDQDGSQSEVVAEQLVMATGLSPNTADLALDRAGAVVNPNGRLVINDEARTSAHHVWAAGAVTGPPFSLSLESHQADLASHNLTAPFFARRKMDQDPFPLTAPIPPGYARIGLTETEARARHKDAHVFSHPYLENERAALTGESTGMVKIVGRKNGQLLGAHVWGRGAEEMILFFDLTIRAGITLHDLRDAHHFPGVTHGEAAGQAINGWAASA